MSTFVGPLLCSGEFVAATCFFGTDLSAWSLWSIWCGSRSGGNQWTGNAACTASAQDRCCSACWADVEGWLRGAERTGGHARIASWSIGVPLVSTHAGGVVGGLVGFLLRRAYLLKRTAFR